MCLGANILDPSNPACTGLKLWTVHCLQGHASTLQNQITWQTTFRLREYWQDWKINWSVDGCPCKQWTVHNFSITINISSQYTNIFLRKRKLLYINYSNLISWFVTLFFLIWNKYIDPTLFLLVTEFTTVEIINKNN